MKKQIYALLIGAIVLGSTMVVAKTGVIVHQKNGEDIFLPSNEVEKIEFVNNYISEEENPGEVPDGDEIDPTPEIPGDDTENPGDSGNGGGSGVGGGIGDVGDGSETPNQPDDEEDQGDIENPEDGDDSQGDEAGNGEDSGNDESGNDESGNDESGNDPEDGNEDGNEDEDKDDDMNDPGGGSTDQGTDSGEESGDDNQEGNNQGGENEEDENPSDQPEENPGDNQEEDENQPGDDNKGDENQGPGNGGDTGESNGDDEGNQGDPGEGEDTEGNENEGDNGSESDGSQEGDEDNEPSEDPSDTVKSYAYQLYTSSTLPLNETYLIVAQGVCATPVRPSYEYGYLPSASVTINGNIIEGNEANGYKFLSTYTANGVTYTAPSGKFMIQGSDGRFLYLKDSYNSYNLSNLPNVNSDGSVADDCLFSAVVRNDGTWTISNTRKNDTRYLVYSSKYGNFAAYNSVSSSDYYPRLYLYGEYDGGLNNGGTGSGDNSGSDSGNTGGDNTGSGSSGSGTTVPEDYKYPLSYVKLPEGTPEQVKEYTGFTLNFNKDNHTANYVAWELLSSETSGSANRNNYKYWVDYDIEGCLSTDFGYSTYNYERGHMCPAADQKWSGAAMKDCMVMANMCPQLRALNSGLWGTLEDKERTWANRDGAIWIVAGPIYDETDNLYVGAAQARVAGAYFKAMLYNGDKGPRAIAFVFQNGSNPGNLESYAMSIDDLERITGYDFFSALPDDIEDAIEATYSFSDWN